MQRQKLKAPVRLNAAVPADLVEAVDRIAEAEQVSRAAIITRLLRDGVKGRK